MKSKICLLVDSLAYGGAEKVAANMSFLLTAYGYDITIFSMRNEIAYPFEGNLYNFGLDKKQYGKIKAFLKFKQFFIKNSFQAIIDHRMRCNLTKEFIFSKFVFRKAKVVYCVHSYNLSYYFSKLKFINRYNLCHVRNRVYVSVSDSVRLELSEVLGLKSSVIYNYVDRNQIEFLAQEKMSDINIENYIIGVGRLESNKQFDQLITSYAKSKLPLNNVNLLILGNGAESERLKSLIKALSLEDKIKILPFRNNPFPLMKKAKALLLTSKFEGFGMVLLESLFLATPVVSFDCKSGPNEIITDGINGILVEDQNKEQLVEALNKLLDHQFYSKLKKNASLGLEKFSKETIVQAWVKLLE